MELSEGTRQAARTAIQKVAKTYGMDITDILFATVKSVDKQARTCTVIPVSGRSDTEIQDVALTIDKNDGELKIPTVDSTVGVALSNQVDAFVIAWSDLDEIIWKGGNFKGLVKVKELTDKLNNLENLVNNLITLYNAHTHPGVQAGAGVTSPTLSVETSTLTPTQQMEIENKKIQHGDS